MIRPAFALVACLVLFGCGAKPEVAAVPQPAPKPSAPKDPERALYEQVRSGAYQINAGIDSIEEVRKTTKDLATHELGQTHEALMSIAKSVSDAGETIADYGADPPTFEQFQKDFAAQDDRRLKAIAAANSALGDLNDAQTLVDQLVDSKPPEPAKTQLDSADAALDDCIQAMEGAIKAMGGKVEGSDSPQ